MVIISDKTFSNLYTFVPLINLFQFVLFNIYDLKK